MDKITYRKVMQKDKTWVNEFIKEHWGSNKVVVHKTIYFPYKLEGFLAETKKERIGLVTYKIKNKKCEIVTLNSIRENKGIGTHLINLVLKKAKERGCNIAWLVTTNDNIKAIYFYQKLGFRFAKVYPGVVNESRILKPEIPLLSENGIQIRDELEFVLKI
jgi:GNAT superfamily N-acetyltransferase